MTNPTDSVDTFLRFLCEETDMLKGIFRSPVGLLQDRTPIFGLDNWPDGKRAVLERLMKRDLVKLAIQRPAEQDFPMWLLTRRSGATTDKNLSELRDEFLQMDAIPVLTLAEEGKQFLAS